MGEVTAQQVSALRKATGAGMMDAKRALEETAGDADRAKDLLREKGLASAAKRTGRVTEQGSIGHYLHFQADRPVIGVLVELASETDFVAKSDAFRRAANDIAMHVAAARPRWVRREDVPEDAIAKERELIAAQARNEGKPESVIAKIIEGRIGTFYEDNVLYDQPFVNPQKFEGTVGAMVQAMAAQMGENIEVARISRLAVGEESE
ncbi:MAG: translation elongation factor Ts [Actinomycetota bacterium]|jgi:elongation factor Ts|nr:translation elongation factor Ts [Actinomycetota bacterium]